MTYSFGIDWVKQDGKTVIVTPKNTNQKTCANCGHEHYYHEKKENVWDVIHKFHCRKLLNNGTKCPCKKFKPQSPLRDYPIRKPLKDYSKPQNQSQTVATASKVHTAENTAKPDTCKGIFSTADLKKEICPICKKSVLIYPEMKLTKKNLKDGIYQVGNGVNKPLITLCSAECYGRFEERQRLKAEVEKVIDEFAEEWKDDIEPIYQQIQELKKRLGISSPRRS